MSLEEQALPRADFRVLNAMEGLASTVVANSERCISFEKVLMLQAECCQHNASVLVSSDNN